MSGGILEVQLVNAKQLRDRDFIKKMDPYVVVNYGNQERKTRVARGQGKSPIWNETLTFTMDRPSRANDQHKISFRIMDKDTFSADDFVGDAVMYVKDVISLGLEQGTAHLPPSKYRVVLKNQNYYGEIQVGVTFIKKGIALELRIPG
ncbi:hypothetical protein ACHQM5_021301 [Ranunculus cassubicifolius]